MKLEYFSLHKADGTVHRLVPIPPGFSPTIDVMTEEGSDVLIVDGEDGPFRVPITTSHLRAFETGGAWEVSLDPIHNEAHLIRSGYAAVPGSDLEPLQDAPSLPVLEGDRNSGLTVETGLYVLTGESGSGKSWIASSIASRMEAERFPLKWFVVGEFVKGTSAITEHHFASPGFLLRLHSHLRSVTPGVIVIDSLSFLLTSGGALGTGGISRTAASYLAMLDDLARSTNKAIIAVFNPLTDRSSKGYSAYLQMVSGLCSHIIDVKKAFEGDNLVHASFSSRGSANGGYHRGWRALGFQV